MNTPLPILALAAVLALTAQPVRADTPAAVPDAGFPASRYEALWTKSPFAVATAEVTADSSPDYFLVGISNIEGISYASVVETKTPQEHFLISSDKPTRGMTLTSITRSHDGADTYAIVQKDGQSITLKLAQPPPTPAGPGPGAPTPNIPVPGGMTPQIFVPGATAPSFPGSTSSRPMPMRHRPIIHLPPPPSQEQQAAPAPPPPPQ